MTIDGFIDGLAGTHSPPHSVNMYDTADNNNEIRRANLKLYLEHMQKTAPDTLLVGEAPGYQGCRWTGVGFCSEYILLKGVPDLGIFGAARGYRKTSEWEKTWKEPSATIVWKSLSAVGRLPLIWASYPFHPHKPGQPLTNRPPTKHELQIGQMFLAELIDMFKISRVIAVGNKAELTLTGLGYRVPKIRHPANGGANLFFQGIQTYLGRS